MVADAVALDEEECVAAASFVKGGLRAPTGQRDGAFLAAEGDGAQVPAEQGGGQAGFAAGCDGRWCAVMIVSDGRLLRVGGASPGGPGPTVVGWSARTTCVRGGWRWWPVCCLFGERGAVGGAAEEAGVDVDPVSGAGQ